MDHFGHNQDMPSGNHKFARSLLFAIELCFGAKIGYAQSDIEIADINAIIKIPFNRSHQCGTIHTLDGPEIKSAPKDLLQPQSDDCIAKFHIRQQHEPNDPVLEDDFSVLYRGQKETAILADEIKGTREHPIYYFAVYAGDASYNNGHHFVLKPIPANTWSIEVCDAYSQDVEKNIAKGDFSGWLPTKPEYGSVPKWCPWQAKLMEVICRGQSIWRRN